MNCIYCHNKLNRDPNTLLKNTYYGYCYNHSKSMIRFDIDNKYNVIVNITFQIENYKIHLRTYHKYFINIYDSIRFQHVLYNCNLFYISPENANEIISNFLLL